MNPAIDERLLAIQLAELADEIGLQEIAECSRFVRINADLDEQFHLEFNFTAYLNEEYDGPVRDRLLANTEAGADHQQVVLSQRITKPGYSLWLSMTSDLRDDEKQLLRDIGRIHSHTETTTVNTERLSCGA